MVEWRHFSEDDSLDRLLGRFLSLEGIQYGVEVGMAGHPLEASRIA